MAVPVVVAPPNTRLVAALGGAVEPLIHTPQAIQTARQQVSFEPTRTQVRLLRQGINARPFWMVSLSIPGEVEGTFRRLAVVKVDANTGQVEDVELGRRPDAAD